MEGNNEIHAHFGICDSHGADHVVPQDISETSDLVATVYSVAEA
jgi:hypothetical protein